MIYVNRGDTIVTLSSKKLIALQLDLDSGGMWLVKNPMTKKSYWLESDMIFKVIRRKPYKGKFKHGDRVVYSSFDGKQPYGSEWEIYSQLDDDTYILKNLGEYTLRFRELYKVNATKIVAVKGENDVPIQRPTIDNNFAFAYRQT